MTGIAALPYLLLCFLGAALLWGSLLALRGRRWWATILMVGGAGAQVLGSLVLAVGMVLLMSNAMRMTGSGATASSVASSVNSGVLVLAGGALLLGLGLLLFVVGFVGFAARSGATELRAAELEGLIGQMRDRTDHAS